MAGSKGWAVVTGASSGLGVELARGVAARGFDLVLVARREGPMQALAGELGEQFDVRAVVEAVDLAASGSATDLLQRLDARVIAPVVLVNNAGFGLSGAFLDHDPARLAEMLRLDIVALTELTQIFGRRMASAAGGRILLVASLAAYQPTPRLAAYGAAKAYVLALGEALHVEMAPKVGVTVLSPGLMDTGFNAVSGFAPKPAVKRLALPPARVARIGLEALFAGRPSVVAGGVNGAMALSSRLMSRHAAAKLALRMS